MKTQNIAFITLCVLAGTFDSCSGSHEIKITGSVKNLEGGTIIYQKSKSRKTKCDGREKRNVIFEAKTKCAQKSRLLPLSSQNTSVVQTPFESCLNDAFLLNFLLKYHLKPIANLAKNRIFT